MDRCVYSPFLKDNGIPIRCCSQAEVDSFLDDMSSIFPYAKSGLDSLRRVFGSKGEYETEVVFRFTENEHGLLSYNFCTKSFYRNLGYKIVDFSDILFDTVIDEEDLYCDPEDFDILFG